MVAFQLRTVCLQINSEVQQMVVVDLQGYSARGQIKSFNLCHYNLIKFLAIETNVLEKTCHNAGLGRKIQADSATCAQNKDACSMQSSKPDADQVYRSLSSHTSIMPSQWRTLSN